MFNIIVIAVIIVIVLITIIAVLRLVISISQGNPGKCCFCGYAAMHAPGTPAACADRRQELWCVGCQCKVTCMQAIRKASDYFAMKLESWLSRCKMNSYAFLHGVLSYVRKSRRALLHLLTNFMKPIKPQQNGPRFD